jgi:hypothetical protein
VAAGVAEVVFETAVNHIVVWLLFLWLVRAAWVWWFRPEVMTPQRAWHMAFVTVVVILMLWG